MEANHAIKLMSNDTRYEIKEVGVFTPKMLGDATADQQGKIATIAKAAVGDLRALREKAQAARAQAVTLLTAPAIDRTAIERLRANPTPEMQAAFDKKFAPSGYTAKDILGRLPVPKKFEPTGYKGIPVTDTGAAGLGIRG